MSSNPQSIKTARIQAIRMCLTLIVGIALGALFTSSSGTERMTQDDDSRPVMLRRLQSWGEFNLAKEIEARAQNLELNDKSSIPVESKSNSETKKFSNGWIGCLPKDSDIPDLIYKSAIESKDSAIRDVVFKAVMESDEPAVRAIVDNVRDGHLQKEIFAAIREFDSERVACLIADIDNLDASVADVPSANEVNLKDSTFLHWAAYYSSDRSAEELVKAGASVDIQNNLGATPLHISAQRGSTFIADLVIRKGADVDTIGPFGYTPLCFAAENPDPNLIQLLIANEADVNAKCGDSDYVLHRAASLAEAEVVEALIEAGADVNVKSVWNETPLFVATKRGAVDVIEVLLRHGADPNARTNYKYTPLMIAAHHCDLKTAKVLIDAGASKTVTDVVGNTPKGHARKSCHDDQSELDALLTP